MPCASTGHRIWAASIGLAVLLGAGCASRQVCCFRQLSYDCYARAPATDQAAQWLQQARASQSQATALEAAASDGCVDWHFAATRWSFLAAQVAGEEQSLDGPAAKVYAESLTSLLRTGQEFGRLDPARGLCVRLESAAITIPVVHHGFVWQASDFQRLAPPLARLPALLRTRYCRPGIGVPLVVTRRRNDESSLEARFHPPTNPFAATAVLNFGETAGESAAPSAVLEFYNPLTTSTVIFGGQPAPLAADLTAPLAAVLAESPRSYLAGFVEPGGQQAESRLAFLEPYQPGKAPVVMIHGLFSDPQAWADMINDLRGSPGFAERFQIWTFRYPTGQGFLQSAARLRGELRAAFHACDPTGSDPGLCNTVLIGHSMGGLLAKLQVTYSDDALWKRLANRPLDEIQTDEATRMRLAEACFFEPLPQVKRLIFIATPHRGSNSASGAAGRLASRIVEIAPTDRTQHDQLIAQNPGVFASGVQTRMPTSVDLLEPRSPALAALREMRVACQVKLHNIVGVHEPLGPSDGVVPAASAWHPDCLSELAIAAPHGRVHRTWQASQEVQGILARHWAEVFRDAWPGQTPQEFRASDDKDR